MRIIVNNLSFEFEAVHHLQQAEASDMGASTRERKEFKITRILIEYLKILKACWGMRYLFRSNGRPISHRNGWLFRVYMILLRDFVPE